MSFRVEGTSNINDFKLSAEACLPIISSIMAEIKNQRYTERCFLNIDFPTDVVNHKVNFILASLSLFDVEFLTWPCIQHSFSWFLDWLTSKVGDHC